MTLYDRTPVNDNVPSRNPKISNGPNIRFPQPGRCDTRCSPTPYRLTLFDRTPLNDDLWIIFFIMMASGAPLARFFCDTPHSAYTKAIVIHSVNKTHFLLFRKQLICMTQTNMFVCSRVGSLLCLTNQIRICRVPLCTNETRVH